MPFEPDPRFSSPEYRAELLLRQRAGKLTVRQLAEETPDRGRSAIAEDLARARREEAIARREAVRAAKARSERPSEPVEKPAADVWLQDPALGAVVRPDGSHVGVRYDDSDVTALRRRNEKRRMSADMNVKAGLSREGFAVLETPLGRLNYDPLDVQDVTRARAYLRDDVERFLLDSGEDPAVAEAAAEERAREWTPHTGPR
jgi:hypothetical protein